MELSVGEIGGVGGGGIGLSTLCCCSGDLGAGCSSGAGKLLLEQISILSTDGAAISGSSSSLEMVELHSDSRSPVNPEVGRSKPGKNMIYEHLKRILPPSPHDRHPIKTCMKSWPWQNDVITLEKRRKEKECAVGCHLGIKSQWTLYLEN